jgi:hypothetical protein
MAFPIGGIGGTGNNNDTQGDGVEVDPNQLDDFAQYLADRQAVPTEVKSLVTQSDVGDQSWGVIGFALKPKYTGLLDQFRDLLDDLHDGLGTASDKFSVSAEEYRASDQRGEKAFKDLIAKRTTTDQVRDKQS